MTILQSKYSIVISVGLDGNNLENLRFVCPPDRKIGEIMHTRIISVDAAEDEKQVRRLFTKYSLLALPVVEETGKLAGIITVDDVLSLPVNTRGLRM